MMLFKSISTIVLLFPIIECHDEITREVVHQQFSVDLLKNELQYSANCVFNLPPCQIADDGKSVTCRRRNNTLLLQEIDKFPPWLRRKAAKYSRRQVEADLVHCTGKEQVSLADTLDLIADLAKESEQAAPGERESRRFIVSFYQTKFIDDEVSDRSLCKFLYHLRDAYITLLFRKTNLFRVNGHAFERNYCSKILDFFPLTLKPLFFEEIEISGSRDLTIDKHAFYGVKVENFKIWHNDFVTLTPDAFHGVNVEHFWLSHNSMKQIDGRQFPHMLAPLHSLHLEYNNVSNLEPAGVGCEEIYDIRYAWLAVFHHFQYRFPGTMSDRLRISPNDWNCDPDNFLLRWIGCSYAKENFLFIRCHSPNDLLGKTLKQVDFIDDKAYCDHKYQLLVTKPGQCVY